MTKEEFLALAARRYEAFQALNQLNSFYDYEKIFVERWRNLGREVLEKNLGKVPQDRGKKLHHPGTDSN